ncbi:hypothetical protein AS156_22165 [Bradyrhizobium macuxiense]|uniref:Uncharacterized protein n=2 Tax=Bradyrhizobium macuxiense TaxID=1755647 RepID=A0A109JBX5_9BRAD|nr:hypothetical protein AS156_22165 [Bradyrhizobium macuxiense]
MGIRFRFFILLPVLFLGVLLVVALSIGQWLSLGEALSITAVFAGCLQVGYLIGAVLKHMVGPALVIDREAPLVVRSSVERQM